MPKDSREREIFERLTAIRDQLLLLKQDRTRYIRSQDVQQLYDQTVEQVKLLNDARKGLEHSENRGMSLSIHRRHHHHAGYVLTRVAKVDKILESCFQLLSLFFMTIGRNSEAPAAYALTSTIKRLLDHLSESKLYSAKDLDSMNKTLDRLEGIVHKSGPNNSPYLSELLSKRVELCKSRIEELQKALDGLAEPLQEVHEKLISIMRSTSLANTKAKVRHIIIHHA